MKIAVAGTGYVGLSIATLLSQNNEVVALDVISEKVDMINQGISPIKDNYIEDYLKNKNLCIFPIAKSLSLYYSIRHRRNWQKRHFVVSAFNILKVKGFERVLHMLKSM